MDGLRWYHILLAILLMPPVATCALVKRIRCGFRGHEWVDQGGPFPVGGTTAPYPAIDEKIQPQVCLRCKTTRTTFAGFVFDEEQKEETK